MGHRMFTDHLVAEKPKRVVSNSGRELEEWDNPFHKDNHWFDTTILTLLAASMQGASLPELQGKGLGGPKKGKVVSFKEQQDERQREKGQMEEWTRGLPGYG